jgi:rhodanese-related sulfurtransferase/ubiquinone/menaquinone biosynthesis C-methylase UbiE
MARSRAQRRTVDDLLEEARTSTLRLTPLQARQAQLEGARIIDIRSDSARERDGIVPDSVHIPRTVLEWRVDPDSPLRNPHLGELEDPVFLLCDHGYSSSLAAYTLVQLGYINAGDVIGGFEAWRDAGLPIEHSQNEEPSTAQQLQWENAFRERADRYGAGPSVPGRAALASLQQIGAGSLLELGAGQGRDTLLFAKAGLQVTALDFAATATAAIAEKAFEANLSRSVKAIRYDVSLPLPFDDNEFDGCFSHMLFCMALRVRQLAALTAEIRRVLRPGGLCIYTARTTDDPDYGVGTHRGENLYDCNGFVVHFFDKTLIDRLAAEYELVQIEHFEEGALPRKLCTVTMRKPLAS